MPLPPLPPAFRWTEATWGAVLECLPLARAARHLFTTRALGSLVLDASAQARWAAVSEHVELPETQLVRARQVHGVAVLEAEASPSEPDGLAEADILIAPHARRAVAVRVADCVPILLADTRTGVVAAVHAGWRGTAAGAVGAAVRALVSTHAASPGDLVAAVGPAIGPCCYVVGATVLEAFQAAGHGRDDLARWFTQAPPLRLDLWQATADQLVSAGVPSSAVHTCGLCTACHLELFYSHRAEGVQAGRMAAAIRPIRPR